MKKILFSLLLIIVIIWGCKVSNKTYSDSDHEIIFLHYKTFAWLPDQDTTATKYPNKIILNSTRNYFTYCMAERGYKGDIEKPDIFLDIVITKSTKQKIATIKMCSKTSCNYFYLNPYYYPYPNPYYYDKQCDYDYGTDYSYVSKGKEYPEGAITLNIIDRKKNKLVWTGTTWGDLYDINYLKSNLHPAVYRILEKFPVMAKKEKN